MKSFFTNFRLLAVVAILFSVCVLPSCDSEIDKEEAAPVEWQKKADFPGVARSSAVSFIIGGKAYVGTGFSGATQLNDFWVYDATSDSWERLADFPGEARSGAVGFSANGKGYIGTGYNGTGYLKDFYEYDPATLTWTQIEDFPGTARFGAIAMSFADKGFVGTGFDGNFLRDFWQYDPATATWMEQPELDGAKRLNGFAFTVNGKGYIGGGQNNGLIQTDLLEFNPANGQWRILKGLKADQRVGEQFPTARNFAATFSINNKGYVVGGTNSLGASVGLSDVWEYDPTTDTWTQRGNFGGGTRLGAVAFGLNEQGFVGLGSGGSARYKDLWQLKPSSGE
ncbi:Kelch repeat-containing protein [Pontibacter mangrovi]|uniref:Galactose oxidase n=1 Tax=Pontibacter mangrovi TaxID=2589816 RepID=A0A501W8K6_9BACT|nr:kelch repeat-containing protein [Pontibacter mangrovi]TPE44865.1 galactose oxidase [Pontibacter mangrovi]